MLKSVHYRSINAGALLREKDATCGEMRNVNYVIMPNRFIRLLKASRGILSSCAAFV